MIVNDHLDKAAHRTKERIQWLLDIEGSPTTLNTHYFASYKDKFLTYYRDARDYDNSLMAKLQLARAPSDFEASVNKALSSLTEIGLSGVKATDLPRLLSPDPMEPALNIMASVRAYFQGKVT